MSNKIFSRLRAGVISAAVVVSQLVMPVQTAFALSDSNNVSTSGQQDNSKVYVCKYVGTPGVNERLQTGQNPIEVSTSSIDHNNWNGTVPGYFSDGQDRSYVIGYVPMSPEPSVLDCPNVVPTNLQISQVPVCGPNNDTISPTATTGVTYSLSSWSNNSLTVTASLQGGYTWSDSTTAAKTFTYTDANTTCGPQPLSIPATPSTNDLCGDGNATWVKPADTAQITWELTGGHLIAHTTTGYVFTDNTDSHDYGVAPDSGDLCPTVPPCTALVGSTIVSKDTQFADSQDTRSKGHYEFTANGLKIYTEDTSSESKVAWYHNVSYPLNQVGDPSIDYQSTFGVKAGMQIGLDKDGNGSIDGILVGEPDFYGNNWWSNANFGVGTGMGYASYGTLDQYLTANPDAVVKSVGFSLGSGVYASGILKSVTFGCYKWTFQYIPSVCTVSDNRFDHVWTYDGTAYPEAGAYPSGTPGTFDFMNDGLYLKTPAEESYVDGLIDAGKTPLKDIDTMSYNTLRQSTSTGASYLDPAYVIYADTDGNVSTTGDRLYFFYEPVYNGTVQTGTWQTWDVLDGGNSKWWGSDNTSPTRTWNQIVAQYPNAIALAYGFNQGTSNAGTNSAVQNMTFDCATTHFSYTQGQGSIGGDTPTTPQTPAQPSTPVTTQGKGALMPTELPETGANGILTTWMTLLAAILTYGAVYFLQPKKRFED